ncbi:MAG: F0F1 ATP synthase subunit B [Verrucomicrobiota bacterium]
MPTLAAAAADAQTASDGGNILTTIFGPFGVQLDMLIAQMLTFAIVAAIIYFLAVKPITATMDERNKKISDGLQYAEEMKSRLAEAEREKTETIREAQQEAQKIVQASKHRADELYNQKTAEAQRKVEDMTAKAREANELERKKLLNEARGEVARLVVATAAQVLEKELDEAERKRFNTAATKQLAG